MAQTPDVVVPNSLNYTDIKPQAVENKIQLCRYQPTATVTGAKGGDMIKFLLSGNGFLDPYSTYFQFVVTCDDLQANEIRFLDRSAHSFISRLVIRSQGVEIERIESYDIIAAMINDMIYSPEQCTQHYWEGFPTHQTNIDLENTAGSSITFLPATGDSAATTSLASFVARPTCDVRDEVFRWLCQGANPTTASYIGETCFHNIAAAANAVSIGASVAMPVDYALLVDYTVYQEYTGTAVFPFSNAASTPGFTADLVGMGTNLNNVFYPLTFAYHQNGMRMATAQYTAGGSANIKPRGTVKMQFIIPIYSGILGLLMPEKKLLPLNLLPLDIEIVFNQHALYSSYNTGLRNYKISEFYIYGNTLFFEQEIHRTLEASVADHGLFIYCNSFHSAPQQIINTSTIPTSNYIAMNLKSINSLHWVFMYTHYETVPCARKLHFVSHNITKMQLLNGTQLIPQYPVEGNSGSSDSGQQLQFAIELYKAWNKMHDPARDGALHAYNTCGDRYDGQFDPLFASIPTCLRTDTAANAAAKPGYVVHATTASAPVQGFDFSTKDGVKQFAFQLVNKQANVGRCQYGISLEGEELGAERTMITGRKAQYPFQLQLWSQLGKTSSKPSYMFSFLRADFIVYIRPDLQIVTLGK